MTSRGRGRGTQSSSRGARARRKDGHARAETHHTVRHRDLDEEKDERLVGDIDESLSRSELSPFLRELESPSNPQGDDLTAHDILEAQRMYEEGDGDFRVGVDVEADPHDRADLRMAIPHHANRQVSSHDFQYLNCWVDGMSRNLRPAQRRPFAHQR